MIRLIVIFVIIAIIVAIIWLLPESEKEKEERMKREEAEREKNRVLTPLEKLMKLIGPEKDEVAKYVKKISDIGDDLLNSKTDNEIIKGITEAYKVYIEEAVKSATDFANKFRVAERYLGMIDENELRGEISMLTERVNNGQDVFKRTLKEKEDILENLKTIRTNQDHRLIGLMEIEAHLRSLQMSLASVATGNQNRESAQKEMNRTISTLSRSLDKTFKEMGKEMLFGEGEKVLTEK